MKGVELKLEELTDSREVMESKESPKIRWFILIFTIIIVTALAFSCIFEIDEYVTVNGEIKTEDVSGNVTSLNSCKIKEIKVKEGQKVSKGDVLFSLDVDYAKQQLQLVQNSLNDNNSKLDDLKILLDSVKNNQNLFPDKTNSYSYRYEQFKTSMELTEQDLTDSINNKKLSSEENEDKLALINTQISENEDLINEYQNLIDCINNDCAYSGNETVYAVYLKYESDYNEAQINEDSYWDNYSSVVDKFNDQQNNITASQIQQAQNSYESASSAISAYTNEYAVQLNNEILLLRSQSMSSDDPEITDKINTYSDLLNAIKGGYSFSSDDPDAQQMYDEYKSQYDSLYSDYLNKLSEYNALYDEYSTQTARVSESDINSAANSYTAASAQKDSVKATYISSIQTNIDTIKNQLISLKSQQQSTEYALKPTGDPEKYAETTKEKMYNEEIVSINTEIDTVKNNIDTSKSQIAELETTVKNGVLTSNVDGTVTLLADLTTGDIVEAGKSVCTIIPDETTLKSVLYIPESEVSKIHNGQNIEYVFDALPYTEFGKVEGKISEISADSVTVESNGMKYYLAQADLSAYSLTNNKNETRTIQTGQTCQAKIISGSKKVIIWLLEKINLRD